MRDGEEERSKGGGEKKIKGRNFVFFVLWSSDYTQSGMRIRSPSTVAAGPGARHPGARIAATPFWVSRTSRVALSMPEPGPWHVCPSP